MYRGILTTFISISLFGSVSFAMHGELTPVESPDLTCVMSEHQILLNQKHQRLWLDTQFLSENGVEAQLNLYEPLGNNSLYVEGQIVLEGKDLSMVFILRENEREVLGGTLNLYDTQGIKRRSTHYDCFRGSW